MSKLTNAIDEHLLGRVALSEPLAWSVESSVKPNRDLNVGYVYNLGVTYRMRAVARDTKELRLIKESFKRQIVQEMFGEFRPLILNIERALCERDWEKSVDAVRQLHNEMFSS